LSVFTAYTVLLLVSTAAAIFLDGEIAINPGELPALRGAILGSVSL
jgi:hypothetical protein